jgi:predicted metalloprotease with PDZ domain
VIDYTLAAPRPGTHLLHVAVEVPVEGSDPVDFVLPSWTPGSYRIRDFARHVQDFSAGGLEWQKADKGRWRVHPRGGGRVRIEYRVWAFELSVRTSHVDAEHAYVNGASVFMHVDGRKLEPVRLRVRPPRGWRVATGLDGSGTVFTAPGYDALVDSPIEMGRFRDLRFRARGKPHRLVVHGEGNYDEKAMLRDLRRIVEEEARMMGDLPYAHYTFLLHTATEGGGGLEHRNSCSLQFPPWHFRPRDRYENFLELVAHEFFHLWNVKRIHPLALGPFDYEREVYTRLLWVMEGVTSYYDVLIPRRAGLFAPGKYLKKIAERIQKYEEKPGRLRQSLSSSSFDAWIGLYQPNENAINAQMSYYEKGGLVGLILDLEIRRRSDGRKSLDDVMRLLYDEYGREERGFPEGEFRAACERVAAADLGAFFRDFIDGTREIPWNRWFETAGIELTREPRKGDDGRPAKWRPWIGVQTQRSGDHLAVTAVVEDSPAERAGLSVRDEVIAVDGLKIDPDGWEKRLEERGPGARVALTLFRRGRLHELPLEIGRRPNVAYALRQVRKPTAAQKKTYEDWLRAKWKE